MTLAGVFLFGSLFLLAGLPASSQEAGPRATQEANVDNLDLEEADVRNDAYEIMARVEQQFDCRLEEHSMRPVGIEPDLRYVIHVTTDGKECRAALVLATNLASREDKLLFRPLQPDSGDETDDLPSRRPTPMLPLSIGQDQLLIHEINPGVEPATPEE